jgi:membrane dipeptidase
MKISNAKMQVVDAHSDYALKAFYDHLHGRKDSLIEFHLPELRKGGVNIEILTVGGDFDLFPGVNNRDPLTVFQIIDTQLIEIARSQGECVLIKRKSDFDLVTQLDKIGFLFAIEGAGMIGIDFSILRNYYRLGLRCVMFTHNERNLLADGCGVNNPHGLTEKGYRFINELENLGIVIDVSHISEPSFWDIVNNYSNPIIASHSNVRKLCDNVRNLTDEQIKAIAGKKGVIGINFYGGFIDKDKNKVNIERLIDHIDYITDLVGVEHVGIGPDFLNYVERDFIQEISKSTISIGIEPEKVGRLEEIREVSYLPILVYKLKARGYSIETIKKIMGKNFVRVYKAIFKE